MYRHGLVLGVLILIAGPAMAQPGGYNPAQSPVSPYLNLLRPGNSPGFNYYGLVRPQMQMQNDIMGLQQQVTNNKSAITDINGVLVPTTGHSTYFMNTAGYFPNRLSGAGGMGARTGGSANNSRPAATGSQMPTTSGVNRP